MWPKIKAGGWELIKFAVITLVIVVPIRTYVAQPFIVSGASMVPTFNDHEYLIVDELSYYLREPKRGEVIIFRYPREPNKFFIKRIIGLPGETVIIKNSQVVIGQAAGGEMTIAEPYVENSSPGDNLTLALGPKEYFVMGDNRRLSLDSRSWGPLPEEFITGRALIRLFPIARAAILPGGVSVY